MDAIILAGGLGTRLQAVVNDVPKCMAPICSKPFLSYLCRYLDRFPMIDKVILSLGHKSEVVIDWIKNNSNYHFDIVYSIEDTPLGTGGAIKQSMKYASSFDVLIVNGDTFFDVDLNLFAHQHSEKKTILSLALKPMTMFSRYGNVEIDNENLITAFNEKALCEKGQINGGMYLLKNEDSLFTDFPDKFSFETDFLQLHVNKSMYGFIHNGYFIDIGIPEDYKEANNTFSTIFE